MTVRILIGDVREQMKTLADESVQHPGRKPEGGLVLDIFGGAGTTGLVADRLGRDAVLIELNPEYAGIAGRRIDADGGMFADVQTVKAAE